MPIKLNTASGGGVTLSAANTATDKTITVPAVDGTMNMSGTANEVPAGSASAPAIYPTGDTNTGIFFPAADTIAFAEGGVESARIDSSGNLLVGKAAVGVSNVGFQVNNVGEIAVSNTATTNAGPTQLNVYSTGASAYRFFVGMGGTVYATSTTISAISDQRLKENVQDLDVGLDAVMQLKPRKFDWKEGKGKDTKGDRGWIAQEFEQVFPDMVDQWKDEAPEGEEPYKSVRADLIPVLVKAIQEQQQMIETLQAKVAALEAQ